MQTTFTGIHAKYQDKLFPSFKLDENKKIFELKNENETQQKLPDDFVFDYFQNLGNELKISFQALFAEESTENATNMSLQLFITKNDQFESTLTKLQRFGFKIETSFQSNGKPKESGSVFFPNQLRHTQNSLSPITSETGANNAETDLVDGQLNFMSHGPISIVKNTSFSYFPQSCLSQRQQNDLDERQSNRNFNYNENLITEISEIFEVKLAKENTEFRFPLFPNFSDVSTVFFKFEKKTTDLCLCKSDAMIFIKEGSLQPLPAEDKNPLLEINDFDKLQRDVRLQDAMNFKESVKIQWDVGTLNHVLLSFEKQMDVWIKKGYHSDTIQKMYNDGVRKQLDSINRTVYSPVMFAKEVRVRNLEPVSKLKEYANVLCFYRFSLPVLERMLELFVKVFEKLIKALSEVIVRNFTFNNSRFKLNQFTFFLMKLISEEIEDLLEAYLAIFGEFLCRLDDLKHFEEGDPEPKFLKELFIVLNKEVFSGDEVEKWLGQGIFSLINETAKCKFSRLIFVKEKFEDLIDSFK